MDIANDSPATVKEVGGEFLSWVRQMYAQSQVMGVRRLNSRDADDASLRRLLEVLRHRPPPGITEAEPKADLKDLWRINSKVAQYATKVVAHRDVAVFQSDLTYGEIHDAIDRLCAMVNRYELALLGSPTDFTRGHAQPWEHAFTVPWREVEIIARVGERTLDD